MAFCKQDVHYSMSTSNVPTRKTRVLTASANVHTHTTEPTRGAESKTEGPDPAWDMAHCKDYSGNSYYRSYYVVLGYSITMVVTTIVIFCVLKRLLG